VVRDLWEEFRISEDRSRTVKEVVAKLHFSKGMRRIWALQEVSFEIGQGETVGLLGENGSGKSTLLKCMAGILPPTKGEVLVGGTVSSLIELGAGFHPDLTGRENAMLTGSLFGLPKSHLQRSFDSIVDFAEMEDSIDLPVRSYSSGMYARLAFSLAVHVEPDLLLVDEVLAVGDESFQRKCADRLAELGGEGMTIVFVSHDLDLARRICRRSLLLSHGRLLDDGETSKIIDEYLTLQHLQKQEAPAT